MKGKATIHINNTGQAPSNSKFEEIQDAINSLMIITEQVRADVLNIPGQPKQVKTSDLTFWQKVKDVMRTKIF